MLIFIVKIHSLDQFIHGQYILEVDLILLLMIKCRENGQWCVDNIYFKLIICLNTANNIIFIDMDQITTKELFNTHLIFFGTFLSGIR